MWYAVELGREDHPSQQDARWTILSAQEDKLSELWYHLMLDLQQARSVYHSSEIHSKEQVSVHHRGALSFYVRNTLLSPSTSSLYDILPGRISLRRVTNRSPSCQIPRLITPASSDTTIEPNQNLFPVCYLDQCRNLSFTFPR